MPVFRLVTYSTVLSKSAADQTTPHLPVEALYCIMSLTLARRLPQAVASNVLVESPISFTMRYRSPSTGLVGSNVNGLIIFSTEDIVFAGMVSVSILNNRIVSSSVVVAIVPTISLPFYNEDIVLPLK